MSQAVNQFFQHGGSDRDHRARLQRRCDGRHADHHAGHPHRQSGLEASSPGPGVGAARDHVTRDPANAALFNLTVEQLDQPGGTRVIASVSFSQFLRQRDRSPLLPTPCWSRNSSFVRVRTAAPDAKSPSGRTQTAVGNATDDGGAITVAEITGNQAAAPGSSRWNPPICSTCCDPALPRDRRRRRRPVTAAAATASAARRADRRRPLDVERRRQRDPGGHPGDRRLDQGQRRAVLPAAADVEPVESNQIEVLLPGRSRRRHLRPHRRPARRLEGARRSRGHLSACRTDRPADRRREWAAQPARINCLRSFPIGGRVVWGARTLDGADQLASTNGSTFRSGGLALFIEESLYRGTQWVVFEPNDEPLWAQIRLNVGAFMHNLFRQGAFQGQTPRDAYFVKCDKETTTQNDINLGIVNILVGFAPLKPAEFVVIQIQQIAGRSGRGLARRSRWHSSPSTRSASIPTRTSSSG